DDAAIARILLFFLLRRASRSQREMAFRVVFVRLEPRLQVFKAGLLFVRIDVPIVAEVERGPRQADRFAQLVRPRRLRLDLRDDYESGKDERTNHATSVSGDDYFRLPLVFPSVAPCTSG